MSRNMLGNFIVSRPSSMYLFSDAMLCLEQCHCIIHSLTVNLISYRIPSRDKAYIRTGQTGSMTCASKSWALVIYREKHKNLILVNLLVLTYYKPD